MPKHLKAPHREPVWVALPVSLGFQVAGSQRAGFGRNVNISSSNAVRFETDVEVAPGATISIALHWPVQRRDGLSMGLMAMATVRSCDRHICAADIQKYEVFLGAPKCMTAAGA